MVAIKTKTNWDHLKNIAHLAGPDAELHVKLQNASPDAEGPPDPTVMVIKCRVGFIRAGEYVFLYPDIHGGGHCGRLQPNVFKLKLSKEPYVLEADCLTDTEPDGSKPDIPDSVVTVLEDAGFHWEDHAPRD